MRPELPPTSELTKEIRRVWPDGPIRRIRTDDAGWTNLMLEVDDRWMVRIPRRRSGAYSLHREVRFLEFLSRHVSAEVPQPRWVGSLEKPAGWPFLVYPKLPGRPLKQLHRLGPNERIRLARFLERLFSELAGSPPAPVLRMGLPPGDRAAFAQRFGRLRERYRRVGRVRLSRAIRSQLESTLDELLAAIRASDYRPVLLHNDLWPSHILWDGETHRPTGVIDWEDARLGDPAFDLVAIEGLGPPLLRRLGEARRQRRDRTFWDRLALYRRILPLGGFLYGVESRDHEIAASHLRKLSRTLKGGSVEVEGLVGRG